MPDRFSGNTRSKIMSSIKSKNTKPELAVRKIVWASGKRYRIHDHSVYGTPDMSNKSKKVAIFIDGCFWHGCQRCYSEPKTNVKFWRNKISQNKSRRKKVLQELKRENWNVLQFWEHQVNSDSEKVSSIIVNAL